MDTAKTAPPTHGPDLGPTGIDGEPVMVSSVAEGIARAAAFFGVKKGSPPPVVTAFPAGGGARLAAGEHATTDAPARGVCGADVYLALTRDQIWAHASSVTRDLFSRLALSPDAGATVKDVAKSVTKAIVAACEGIANAHNAMGVKP